MKRRDLLKMTALGAGISSWPRPALATTAARDRKFLFVRVPHGWDTTRVFSPMFDTSGVSMESDAFSEQIEDIVYVSHDERPSVDQFFSDFASRTAILNGLIVPSVNHAICDRLLYSDSSTGSNPDWGTQIASAQAERYSLPHVLISGRVIAGNRANIIVNVGTDGQMDQLLTGNLMPRGDLSVSPMPNSVASIVSKHLSVTNSTVNNEFSDFYQQSMDRIQFIREISDSGTVNWNTDGSMTSQIELARDLLGNDLARCVTMEFTRSTFDSHVDNDSKQSANYEDLFSFLHELILSLQETVSVSGSSLLDEVCVVVLSEMGRTPYQNGGKGKDHWQHTSGMLIGSGIQGGRTYGEYSSLFYGQTIDLVSGDVTSSGQDISTRLLGDTLLALGDVGNEFTPLGDPIWALMSS
jgi:hypothetical protein